MYKQDNKAFPEEINRYGCYLFCLLRMCEVEAAKEFSTSQILKIYEDSKAQGWIINNCSVVNPDKVCMMGLLVFGTPKVILQVGQLENGKPELWGWVKKSPKHQTISYIALKFKTTGEIGHHYVLGDRNYNILFDPSVKDYTKNPRIGGLIHNVS